MKVIRGHKSWNEQEVIKILLTSGSFSCCTLPHYRYDRVKSICGKLRRKGWIVVSGHTETGTNYKPTELMMANFNKQKEIAP